MLDGKSFTFENVSFSYHEGTEVLHDINFKTGAGRIYRRTNGSGKSTVANHGPVSGMYVRMHFRFRTVPMCETFLRALWNTSRMWHRTLMGPSPATSAWACGCNR